MKKDVERFVEKFVEEIRSENAAVFLGAGASKAAGHVDWSELLAPLAKELELDIEKESDLVALAQFYENQTRDRATINQYGAEGNNALINQEACCSGAAGDIVNVAEINQDGAFNMTTITQRGN